MPVPRQYSPSVQAYYYFQYSAGTDIWYRHSTIFSTAPVPTNNFQPSDISEEYQYPAVFHPVLCQYNASTDIRPAVLARYQASCKFPPGIIQIRIILAIIEKQVAGQFWPVLYKNKYINTK